MSDTRRIKINYRKVNVDKLCDWLAKNHIKYAFIPYDDSAGADTRVGTLVYFVEVYSARHETAIRITWDTEQN